MRASDFDFILPPDLIAQSPLPGRDQSRLLVVDRKSGGFTHRSIRNFPEYLQSGDVVVLNNSRVIPARLRARNLKTGGKFEVLLVEENGVNDWWAMMRPGKRARVGSEIIFHDRAGAPTELRATVIGVNDEGLRRLQFSGADDLLAMLETIGEVPLPPYIARDDPAQLAADKLRYQTVYAGPAGSVAAPTAGLHFTENLLAEIRARGIQVCFVTLHVGLGTFAPVKSESLADHVMHEERYELDDATARLINAAKAAGRRIIAVGTTSMRVVESVGAQNGGKLISGTGRTRIFIHPPAKFSIVDALLTNFHLPRSTLLMLVSAFATPGEMRGREMILAAYAEAIRERYRFFSYGDAMLLV